MNAGESPAPVYLLENALSGKRSKKLRQLARLAKAPLTQYLINTITGVIVLGKSDRLACKKLKQLGNKLDVNGTLRRLGAGRVVSA